MAAVSLVLLLIPNATGGSIVVLTAPYAGVSVSPSSSLATVGCSRATIHVAPYFHAQTGKGRFFESASAGSCNAVGGSGASTSAGFGVSVPVRFTHSTASLVAVTVIRAWVAAPIVRASCSISNTSYAYCAQSSYASLQAAVYLTDQTSGGYYYSNTTWTGVFRSNYVDYYCYQQNCSAYTSNGTGPNLNAVSVAWSFNLTSLTTSDKFALLVYFYSYASAGSAAYHATMSSGETTASVNAATLGDGIDLASISIG